MRAGLTVLLPLSLVLGTSVTNSSGQHDLKDRSLLCSCRCCAYGGLRPGWCLPAHSSGQGGGGQEGGLRSAREPQHVFGGGWLGEASGTRLPSPGSCAGQTRLRTRVLRGPDRCVAKGVRHDLQIGPMKQMGCAPMPPGLGARPVFMQAVVTETANTTARLHGPCTTAWILHACTAAA